MKKTIDLLFTNDKKYYTEKNNMIIWNYFIPNDLDDFISYLTFYQPNLILIDSSVDHNTISECISKIKHTYSYSPITVYAKKEKILEIILSKLLSTNKSSNQIAIPIEIEKKLDYALAELKFSPTLKGYNFIKRCIFEGICNPTIFENIEKNLYYKIADIYLTTKYSVERGINFSIKKAFLENSSGFNTYFDNLSGPPSNGKFLKTLLIYIKYLEMTPGMQSISQLERPPIQPIVIEDPDIQKEWYIPFTDIMNGFF
jgi:hypothetical protein